MIVVDDLFSSARAYQVTTKLPMLQIIQDNTGFLFFKQYLASPALISSRWQRVKIPFVREAVVLTNGIFNCIGPANDHWTKRTQERFFYLPFGYRALSGKAVRKFIGGSGQPGQRFGVQQVDIDKSSVIQKVLFNILDQIFYFAFAVNFGEGGSSSGLVVY